MHSLQTWTVNGSLAQLVERHVYTVDVIGSIPVGPTTNEPRHFDTITVKNGGVLCVGRLVHRTWR